VGLTRDDISANTGGNFLRVFKECTGSRLVDQGFRGGAPSPLSSMIFWE